MFIDLQKKSLKMSKLFERMNNFDDYYEENPIKLEKNINKSSKITENL